MLSEKKQFITEPSPELAWMIGVLSGRGSVRLNHGIILYTTDVGLRHLFKTRGEMLFKSNVTFRRTKSWGPDEQYPVFYNRNVIESLGPIGRQSWVKTFEDKHSWINSEERYLWRFIEGFFDARGHVKTKPNHREILFVTTYQSAANFIADSLVRIGINNPSLMRDKNKREGLLGVVVYNIPDIKTIAKNIHSAVDSKEEGLEFFRKLVPVKNPVTGASDEELVEEWIKLHRLIQHTPTSNVISELQKLGETRFSPDVYAYRFGRFDGRRNFTRARKTLDSIVEQRLATGQLMIESEHQEDDSFRQQVNQELEDYEKVTSLQVRFTEKRHNSAEERDKRRLEKLVQRTKNKFTSS